MTAMPPIIIAGARRAAIVAATARTTAAFPCGIYDTTAESVSNFNPSVTEAESRTDWAAICRSDVIESSNAAPRRRPRVQYWPAADPVPVRGSA